MCYRESGIVLHPTSLPGKYGIGTLGESAYQFIDFLSESKQSIWQIFPLSPTGYGDSPYLCFSGFAGNPLLIDFDQLVSIGLLKDSDIDYTVNFSNERVDFGRVISLNNSTLRKSYKNFLGKKDEDLIAKIADFKKEHHAWLENYSLFMALKNEFSGKPWFEWEDDIKFRKESTVQNYLIQLSDEIEYNVFIQYLFFSQWKKLRDYANSRSIKILGDIPIFVSLDSADTWANPSIFHFDDDLKPTRIAGVPPDYFSDTGQIWGNPLYDWDELEKSNYKWWIDRVKANHALYDILRIDHFRAFAEAWSIPYGETDPKKGAWEESKGYDFFTKLFEEVDDLSIIVEDLGTITESVDSLREAFGFPGMKVLQLGFDISDTSNTFLPHHYYENTVAYTSTHDNNTIQGWFDTTTPEKKDYAMKYLNSSTDSFHWDSIRNVWSSPSKLVLAPLQDILGLGEDARMTTPGVVDGCWQWRFQQEQLTSEVITKLKELTELYQRN